MCILEEEERTSNIRKTTKTQKGGGERRTSSSLLSKNRQDSCGKKGGPKYRTPRSVNPMASPLPFPLVTPRWKGGRMGWKKALSPSSSSLLFYPGQWPFSSEGKKEWGGRMAVAVVPLVVGGRLCGERGSPYKTFWCTC